MGLFKKTVFLVVGIVTINFMSVALHELPNEYRQNPIVETVDK